MACGDAGERLAGADDVRDERAFFGLQDPRDGFALVRIQVDVGADAGEGEVGAVVFTRVDAVEPFVVHVFQHACARRVGPHPFGERLFDGVALLVQQCGGLRVPDPFLAGRVVRIGFGEVAGRGVERSGHDLERLRPAPVPRPYLRMVSSSSFEASDVDLPVAGRFVVADRKAPHTAVGDVGLVLSPNVSIMKSRITGRDPREPSYAVMSSWVSRARQRLREPFAQGLQALQPVHVGRFVRVGAHPRVPPAPPHCSRPSMSTISSNGLNVFWFHEL